MSAACSKSEHGDVALSTGLWFQNSLQTMNSVQLFMLNCLLWSTVDPIRQCLYLWMSISAISKLESLRISGLFIIKILHYVKNLFFLFWILLVTRLNLAFSSARTWIDSLWTVPLQEESIIHMYYYIST